MININTGRTWKNAPSGVRDARTLAWLGVIGSGLCLFILIAAFLNTGFAVALGSPVIWVEALLFPFYVWLLGALKRGATSAYYIQMVVSILGLMGFPLGTLISLYVLFKWFKPETRAWFGA